VPPLPPRDAPSPAASNEIAQLRVLSDILDEIREELQRVTRNGLPVRELPAAIPTLKRMAINPCAEDLGERLVIEYGHPKPKCRGDGIAKLRAHGRGVAQSIGTPLAPTDELFVAPGEQRRLF
jgi:hypothetical protein